MPLTCLFQKTYKNINKNSSVLGTRQQNNVSKMVIYHLQALFVVFQVINQIGFNQNKMTRKNCSTWLLIRHVRETKTFKSLVYDLWHSYNFNAHRHAQRSLSRLFTPSYPIYTSDTVRSTAKKYHHSRRDF